VRSDASFGTRWLIAGAVTAVVSAGILALLFRSSPTSRAARLGDEASSTEPIADDASDAD
jgi:hypothetical protein